MAVAEPISFTLANIKTDEFAIIDNVYTPLLPYEVDTNVSVGYVEHIQSIAVQVKFNFLFEKKIFLVTAMSCLFQITKDSWAQIYNEQEKKLTLPNHAALHFVTMVIGTARGLVHAKTENTFLVGVIVPPMNARDAIRGDVEMINNQVAQITNPQIQTP